MGTDVTRENSIFFNHSFDKKRLKALISWVFKQFGEAEALKIIDLLKETGFRHATLAGISIGLHDLTTPIQKSWLVSESQLAMNTTERDFIGARITATERSQRIIDTWHRASESLSKQVVDYFGIYDRFNPVYIMALSGARGNFSQVRQLIGMRGLMADQQGKIVNFPIRSNLREGLTLTEYFISCSGARKGLVDTALRTADTGYLTRRLVDVSHHVVVKRIRCNTNRGIVFKSLQSYNKILLALKERLVGRVLAEDVFFKNASDPYPTSSNETVFGKPISAYQIDKGQNIKSRSQRKVAKKDQEISLKLALKIAKVRDSVYLRSPLTCGFTHSVCQLCYGWSISQGSLVSLGDAVGVIAAQSIGEPGTQLTMRTFHTGGVFSGDLLQEIKAPHAGKIEFAKAFQGLLIRTAHGRIAFLSKTQGSLFLKCTPSENKENSDHFTTIPIPAFTMLFVRQGENVENNQLLAEFSIRTKEGNQPIKTQQTIFAELSGRIVEDCSGKSYTRSVKESALSLDSLEEDLPFFSVHTKQDDDLRKSFMCRLSGKQGSANKYKSLTSKKLNFANKYNCKYKSPSKSNMQIFCANQMCKSNVQVQSFLQIGNLYDKCKASYKSPIYTCKKLCKQEDLQSKTEQSKALQTKQSFVSKKICTCTRELLMRKPSFFCIAKKGCHTKQNFANTKFLRKESLIQSFESIENIKTNANQPFVNSSGLTFALSKAYVPQLISSFSNYNGYIPAKKLKNQTGFSSRKFSLTKQKRENLDFVCKPKLFNSNKIDVCNRLEIYGAKKERVVHLLPCKQNQTDAKQSFFNRFINNFYYNKRCCKSSIFMRRGTLHTTPLLFPNYRFAKVKVSSVKLRSFAFFRSSRQNLCTKAGVVKFKRGDLTSNTKICRVYSRNRFWLYNNLALKKNRIKTRTGYKFKLYTKMNKLMQIGPAPLNKLQQSKNLYPYFHVLKESPCKTLFCKGKYFANQMCKSLPLQNRVLHGAYKCKASYKSPICMTSAKLRFARGFVSKVLLKQNLALKGLEICTGYATKICKAHPICENVQIKDLYARKSVRSFVKPWKGFRSYNQRILKGQSIRLRGFSQIRNWNVLHSVQNNMLQKLFGAKLVRSSISNKRSISLNLEKKKQSFPCRAQIFFSHKSEDLESDTFKYIEPVKSGRLGFLKILSTRVGATFDYMSPIRSFNQLLIKRKRSSTLGTFFTKSVQNNLVKNTKKIDNLSTRIQKKIENETNSNFFLAPPCKQDRIKKIHGQKALLPLQSVGKNLDKTRAISKELERESVFFSSLTGKYLHPESIKENRFFLQTIAEYGDIVEEGYSYTHFIFNETK